MARQSRLSAAEKAEIVLRCLRQEDSAARFARRYGPSEQTLYRYPDAFLAAGKTPLAGNLDPQRYAPLLERAVVDRE